MASVGGSALTYIYRMKADHTGVIEFDGTTTPAAVTLAAMTATGDVLKIGQGYSRNDILVQTDYTYNDDGTLSIKWQQTKNDASLDAFMAIAAPRKLGASSTSLGELIDERGIKIGGDAGSSSDVDFLVISYGAEDSDGTIPVVCSIGNILKTSGTYSMSANNWNQPTLEFKSKAALANYTIPMALFDGTVIDIDGTPAWVDVTLGKDYYEKKFRRLAV